MFRNLMKSTRRFYPALLVVLALSMLLAACGTPQPGAQSPATQAPAATPPADSPVSSTDPTQPIEAPTEPVPGSVVEGEQVYVESIDLRILESFPVRVQAVVAGNLPDGCTTIQRAEAGREGEGFKIRIFTARPADAMCTQALVPFEQIVPLPVEGLAAGTYPVEAYGQTVTLEMNADNALPGEQDPSQPTQPAGQTGSVCGAETEFVKVMSQNLVEQGAPFCFLYPTDFKVVDPEAPLPIVVTLRGPSLDTSIEPLAAFMNVEVYPAQGKDARAFADADLAALPEGFPAPIESMFGVGEPQQVVDAIVLDGMPGQLQVRKVYFAQGENVFVLTFSPLEDGDDYAMARADMERLYSAVMNTWRFAP